MFKLRKVILENLEEHIGCGVEPLKLRSNTFVTSISSTIIILHLASSGDS